MVCRRRMAPRLADIGAATCCKLALSRMLAATSGETTGALSEASALRQRSGVVRAYAAPAPGANFELTELHWGALLRDEVEVAVEACGVCHSDLAMWRDAWSRKRFPLVAGHEVVGRVVALGKDAHGLEIGQRVGIGWYRRSCLVCSACRCGDLQHCIALQRLMIDGYGGFAERVRCHWAWALPLPGTLDPACAGSLFCAGITAYAPIARHVHPSHRVGVVGIGGIGHLAVRLLRAWGCEVVAIVRDEDQAYAAQRLGAHRSVLSGAQADDLRRVGALDLLLIATSANLPWPSLMGMLAPQGRLHLLAMGCEAIPLVPAELIPRALTVSSSPLGRPDEVLQMLSFCARHGIQPQVERLPMSRINEAFAMLESGDVRYRLMLTPDIA